MGICVSCRRRERKAPEKRSGAGLGAGGPGKGPAAAELLPRRVGNLPAMANSISNIKMTNPIKGIVSKRRKRYIKDGFNLDLAYITDRLIAMGFPAEKLEGVYRNHIDEVYRFLEQMHKDHYKIYNLCSERSYDSSKFHERVERYAFEDHTPPNMELIQPFCEDVHSWLSADPRNVAAVHCKAGKGRTGTMVCCYLLYSGQKATADEALQFYGTKRAHDEKGVTIPSQRRYVEYYASLVRSGLQYQATKLYIRELVMSPPPQLNGGQCTLELTVSQAQPPFKVTLEAPHGCHEVRKHARCVRVALTHCTPLRGDVRVDVYNKPKMMMRKEKLFHFWFNTFFLAGEVGAQRIPPPADSPNQETYKLTLNKWQLDDAHKDKQHKLYSPDFKVELIVQKQPESSTFSAHPPRPRTPASDSTPSDTRSDTEPDDAEHWDSDTPLGAKESTLNLQGLGTAAMDSAPDLNTALLETTPGQQATDLRHSDYHRFNPTDTLKTTTPSAKKSPENVHFRDYERLTPSESNISDYSKFPEPQPDYILLTDDANISASDFGSTYEFRPNEDSTKYKDDEKMCLVPETQPICIHPSVHTYEVLTNNDRSEFDSKLKPLYNLVKTDHPVPGNGHSKAALAFNLDVPGYPDFPGACPLPTKPDDPPAYKLLPDRDRPETRQFNKPRLSLTDVRASWREFSGRFSDHRKKRDKD